MAGLVYGIAWIPLARRSAKLRAVKTPYAHRFAKKLLVGLAVYEGINLLPLLNPWWIIGGVNVGLIQLHLLAGITFILAGLTFLALRIPFRRRAFAGGTALLGLGFFIQVSVFAAACAAV
jgi:hypothetical protein